MSRRFTQHLTCDNCGITADSEDGVTTPEGWTELHVGGLTGDDIDLCARCTKRFNDWRTNEKQHGSRRTAHDWAAELGVTIVDHDGWRLRGEPSDFDHDLISREDFDRRAAVSTLEWRSP